MDVGSSDHDGPDFYDERTQRARKEHRCCACGEAILPGHRYLVAIGKWYGEVSTLKQCGRCSAIYKELMRRSDQANADGPLFNLGCGHTWQEVFHEEPPEHISALAFALPGEVEPDGGR